VDQLHSQVLLGTAVEGATAVHHDLVPARDQALADFLDRRLEAAVLRGNTPGADESDAQAPVRPLVVVTTVAQVDDEVTLSDHLSLTGKRDN
jgi:hypothetical protein